MFEQVRTEHLSKEWNGRNALQDMHECITYDVGLQETPIIKWHMLVV